MVGRTTRIPQAICAEMPTVIFYHGGTVVNTTLTLTITIAVTLLTLMVTV